MLRLVLLLAYAFIMILCAGAILYSYEHLEHEARLMMFGFPGMVAVLFTGFIHSMME